MTHKNICVLSYKNSTDASQKPVIIVSKKVSPRAVVRNKVRRRVREILMHHPTLPTGKRVYVRCLPGIEKTPFLELKETLKRALSQAV